MGRPKVHDERSAGLLLDAAEALIGRRGIEALSVRGLVQEAGTSTRAIYSLFGSRDGLLDALGARALDWLAEALDAQTAGPDPATDVIDAALAFRRLVLERPGLLLAVVQGPKSSRANLTRQAGAQALTRLTSRLERLRDAGLLVDRTPAEAAWQFHALCEGVAMLELRAAFPAGTEVQAWRQAFGTLVAGFGVPSG